MSKRSTFLLGMLAGLVLAGILLFVALEIASQAILPY